MRRRSSPPTQTCTPTRLRGHGMCLCGMLAAEYETLPPAMRESVLAFFDENEVWLAGGARAGTLRRQVGVRAIPRDTARMIISTLEGAMLVARPYGELSRFQATATALLAGLAASGSPLASRLGLLRFPEGRLRRFLGSGPMSSVRCASLYLRAGCSRSRSAAETRRRHIGALGERRLRVRAAASAGA